VLCPLVPGLAAGTDASELSSWKDWYAALEAAHDELRSRCEIILVGGISAGSVLALRLARERHANVHGLILFSPTLWPNGWAIPRSFILFRLIFYKWFARLFRFRQRPPFGLKDERVRNVFADRLQDRLGGGLLWEFKAMVADVKRRLAMVNQPAHIFHAREDDQSDLGTAEIIALSLGGPVELTILDDSYHLITFDRQRSVVVDRTVEFVFQITQRVLERRAVVDLKRRSAMVESALAPAPSLSRPA
jgi:carboxylesterase